MKPTRHLVLIGLAMQLSVAIADDLPLAIPAVDTSAWKCKYCVVEEGWSGEIELGLGYVSDDSFKFGEYTGLNEKGGFFIGNADMYYRAEDASYIDLSVSRLGLDSRSLSIEGGVQGRYKLFLHYDELPHFISNTTATPYSGSESLTLPPTWVEAGTTGGMTGLATSLHDIDLSTQRKRLAAGLAFTTDSPWGYAVKFSHETKEGVQPAAGTFYFSAAQLAEPVDYVTDDVDASVSYNAKKWQANLAYYGSIFSNNKNQLTWQNAYTPLVAGADSGQLALPPDNLFHQFVLSSGYEISDRSHVSGDIAIGRMEQRDSFLAATQNPNLAVPLPANSANAKVNTLDAKLKYMSMLTDKLRLNASFTYNDRDNKTPQLSYDWVTTDTFAATPRSNQPYSFTRNLAKVSADYKVAKRTKLGVGYDMDTQQRTLQEVDKTKENTLWGRIRVRSIENLFLEFKLAQSDREGSTYSVVSAIDPPENILLRKYNMADRVRNTIGLHANITPQSRYAIGLNLDVTDDDYEQSALGLTESRDISLNADITAMFTEKTSANFFIGRQQIESTQLGSQTFSTADWQASNDDTFDNIGIGVTHVVIEDRLDIGADYTKASSTGKVTVNSGAPAPPFPDLTTDLDSFKIYANYRLSEMLYLKVAFWHEVYDSSDWALDGVSADTIPNLLSFGELSPSYNVNVIKLSMSYKF